VLLCITKNKNKTIPCFVEMKINATNKISGFLLESPYNFPYSSQNCVFNSFPLPQIFPLLGNPKSHYHDLKPTRIQNSKL